MIDSFTDAQAIGMAAMPASGSVDDFLVNLSRARGRGLVAMPCSLTGSVSGVWAPTVQHDVILYSAASTPARKVGIVCHEVAHILLKHDPAVHASISSDSLAGIAPSVRLDVAASFLARSDYTTPEEVAAETLGTVFSARLSRLEAENSPDAVVRVAARLR